MPANSKGFSVLPLIIAMAVLLVGAGIYIVTAKPAMFDFINDKIASIRTPESSPLAGLSAARDLTGTWGSSLSGKGLEIYGKFDIPGSVTTIYEHGDMELIIENMEGNIAYGKMRYYNLCASGESIVPNYGTIKVPENCVADTGFSPVEIKVSASHVDFGTINTNGMTFTMQGDFTTDLMSGTMSATLPPYGELKGEFHIQRKD